jgi:hypothetical protein
VMEQPMTFTVGKDFHPSARSCCDACRKPWHLGQRLYLVSYLATPWLAEGSEDHEWGSIAWHRGCDRREKSYKLNPATQPWDGDAYGFDEPQARYKRERAIKMAAAAVQALELQEEWSNAYEKRGNGGAWRDERTAALPLPTAEANMRMNAAEPPEWIRNMRIESRLVGSWVVVEPGEEQ